MYLFLYIYNDIYIIYGIKISVFGIFVYFCDEICGNKI